jgi:hypothetical protein
VAKSTFVKALKFNPNHDKLGLFTSTEGGGGGAAPPKSAAYNAYVARYPNYQPEVDAFLAKNPRKGQMDLEVRAHPDGIPSYEFQVQVEQAAHKRLLKERREAKAVDKAKNKPIILAQMKEKYGLAVGDAVFDRETGAKGIVRWGKDGQPHVETAMGKHLVGVRWTKTSGKD